MKSKDKFKCSSCGKLTHGLYGPQLELCYNCFSKGKFETRIPNGPLIFDEVLSIAINPGQFNITEGQSEILEERLNYLFPDRRKDHRFSSISKYLRLLVLNDLGSQSHGRSSK